MMADCIERESVYNLLTSLLNDIYDDTERSTEFTSGFEQALRCVTDTARVFVSPVKWVMKRLLHTFSQARTVQV